LEGYSGREFAENPNTNIFNLVEEENKAGLNLDEPNNRN